MQNKITRARLIDGIKSALLFVGLLIYGATLIAFGAKSMQAIGLVALALVSVAVLAPCAIWFRWVTRGREIVVLVYVAAMAALMATGR